eukprot:TRINITY_DN30697_c0_g1_i1.p1 TRINITY_DN30697_c0_g1~~TRINITY_DN30697_c0_g1_i1.p1  ORF type:complete len:1121 (-),score=265.13 TRINITY_DN30697_c0_g1_i1:138-3500(-)
MPKVKAAWPENDSGDANGARRHGSIEDVVRTTSDGLGPSQTACRPGTADSAASIQSRPGTAETMFRTQSASSLTGSSRAGKLSRRGSSRKGSSNAPQRARANLRHTIQEGIIMERLLKEEADRLSHLGTPMWIRIPRAIVENSAFAILTTVLTIYALVADDFRLMLTNRPADIGFDVCTCFCLLVFSVEILLSCLGKADYIGGFFFWLDLISTVTLILDITAVNESVVQGDEEDIDQMKSSRSARIGARAARIVRVLRLVRILKLYKAVYEQRQKRDAEEKAKKIKEREEKDVFNSDWDETDEDEDEEEDESIESMTTESKVGKKLSDLTTRRCVLVVLTMMMAHPMIQPQKDNYSQSSAYGADTVNMAFQAMRSNSSKRWLYEEALLRYIYYHNWFSYKMDEACEYNIFCPADYARHVFWVGLSADSEDILRRAADEAEIQDVTVAQWAERSDTIGRTHIFGYGSIPSAVSMLSRPWEQRCDATSGRKRLGLSFLSKDYGDVVDYLVECPEDLRQTERVFQSSTMMTRSAMKELSFVFYYDKRPIVREEALKNFLITCFICMVLCGAAAMFTHDANTLVLAPLEQMMLKVHMIRINPLIAAQLADEAFKREEMEKAKAARIRREMRASNKDRAHVLRQNLRQLLMCSGKPPLKQAPMETMILEKTIIKLGTLLALGFGAAGVNTISKNMQNDESCWVDSMVDGSIVQCSIASVRIGDAGTFTEVLQGRVMTFVNQVAEIIHGVADYYYGAPSRNDGDGFLVVWRIPEEDGERFQQLANNHVVDNSMMAVCLMLANVHRSPVLAGYRAHPALQQRLGSRCRVRLCIGLHVGWAIEGALGSEYKIDATYVSPNVSIAGSAALAADAYGTSIVMTQAAHGLLSSEMTRFVQVMDRVKIAGDPQPMNIYHIALNFMMLSIEKPIGHEIRWNTRQRFVARCALEVEKQEKYWANVAKMFADHPHIAAMRRPYKEEFREVFGMGYQNYLQGEWSAARKLLERALEVLGFEDGPSMALLRFMDLSNFTAPDGWRGVHLLEDMLSRAECSCISAQLEAAAAEQPLSGKVTSLEEDDVLTCVSMHDSVHPFATASEANAGGVVRTVTPQGTERLFVNVVPQPSPEAPR